MRTRKLYLLPIVIFFILLGLYVRDEMIHMALVNVLVKGETGNSRYYIVGMMLIGLFSVFSLQHNNSTTRLPKEGRYFNAFILITYFLSIFLMYHSGFALLSDYIARLLPIIALYITYSFFQRVDDKEKVLIWFYIYAVFLAYFYLRYSSEKLYYSITEDITNGSVYSLLYLLPVLLCTKRKVIKFVAIGVIGALVIMAAKRGGFIAYLLGITIYVLVEYVLANKLKFWHIILAGCILAAIFVLLNYLQNEGNLFLFARMEGNDISHFGSRSDLYPKVFSTIVNSDIIGMLLGHGYNSVILDGTMGFSAHNDFLEIWYDFGLVGFISYLVLWCHVIKVGIRMIKNKSIFAAPYSFTLTLLFVNSMVSVIYLSSPYLIMFSVSLGAMWGLYYREQKEKRLSVSVVNNPA